MQPSTIGRISRCTPSRETSGPFGLPPLPVILSISSIKIMPFCSARCKASAFMLSVSISFSHCSCSYASFALATVIFLRLRTGLFINDSIMSPMLNSTTFGDNKLICFGCSFISISITRSLYVPASNSSLIFCLRTIMSSVLSPIEASFTKMPAILSIA